MSYTSISTFVLVVALLYAAANPVAQGTSFEKNLNVTGRLCCTADGNCLAASTAVVGVVVNLNCPTNHMFGRRSVVGQGTTDAAGNFTIMASIRSILTLSQCSVNVPLPLTGAAAVSCPLLASATTSASLTSRLQLVSITGSRVTRVYNAIVISLGRV